MEKCLDKREKSKQTPKHELGKRNKQMVESAGRSSLPKQQKKQLKQQR